LVLRAVNHRRTPIFGDWFLEEETEDYTAFVHPRGIRVLSSVDRSGHAQELEHHISVSFRGQRPPDPVVEFVRKAFQMEESQEDNPEAKVARHFWLRADLPS
jgi:hypothetical protein